MSARSVMISSPDLGPVHTRTTVEANGWGDASVTLEPAASLSGTIVDGRAVAIDGVTVTAELEGHVLAEATTGADGVYLLGPLPAGTITVRARIAKDVCLPKAEIVSTVAGQRTTHRIELECAWQGHAPPGQP